VEFLFGIWPFNMESGPTFLYFFALLAALALFVAKFASDAYGRAKDRVAARSKRTRRKKRAAATLAKEPYRDAPNAPRAKKKRYGIGSMPSPDEYWGLAYLFRGAPAVRDLAFSTAMTCGLLTVRGSSKAKLLFHRERTPPDDRVMRDMYYEISSAIGPSKTERPTVIIRLDTAVEAAETVADAHTDRLERKLTAAGLLRAASTRAGMARIVFGVGGLVECIGCGG